MSARVLKFPRVPPIKKVGGPHKVKTKLGLRQAKHKKAWKEDRNG